jgi:hypothetical protein
MTGTTAQNVDCHDCDGEAPCCEHDEPVLDMLLEKYHEYYVEAQPSIIALRKVIARLEAPYKTLSAEISQRVIREGRSADGHGVTATYRHGYIRHKWDNEGLQGYAVANPDVLVFHSETEVEPTCAIKVKAL